MSKAKSRKKRSTIGLLLDWPGTPYQMKLWSGVADYAREEDVNLICFIGGAINSPYTYEQQRNKLYDLISEDRVDGLVILTSTIGHFVGYNGMRDFFARFDYIPLVSIATQMENVPSVVVDNELGMRDLMNHLIEVHGYRRLAFIGGPEHNADATQRLYVYKDVLRLSGIEYDQDLYIVGDFEMLTGQAAIHTLIGERKVDFDVVISANDEMAIGAVAAIRELGYRVPEDIAVVGFDDIDINKSITPLLTTVRQPIYQQGRIAAELALSAIRGKDVAELTILPTELILRESCGCFSRMMKSIVKEKLQNDNTGFQELYQTNRQSLLEDINRILAPHLINFSNFTRNSFSERVEQLLSAFQSDLTNKKEGTFLSIWKDILYLATTSGPSAPVWQQVLSVLHMQVLPLIHDRIIHAKADEILLSAREMVEETEKQELDYRLLSNARETLTIRALGEQLLASMNLTDLIDLLEKALPKLGIKSCYLSLYEGEHEEKGSRNESTDISRLIVAFNENGKLDLTEEGISYPSKELIPAGMFPKNRRFAIMVDALDYSKNQLGIAFFEMGLQGVISYDLLRKRLQEAVKGVLLLQRVHAQTIALTKTNEKLQEEIAERERAEKALRESELYLRAILDANPIPLVIYRESDGRILYANECFGHTFGFDNTNIDRRKIKEYFNDPVEYRHLLDKLKVTCFDTRGYVQNYEVSMKKEDGTQFWVVISLQTFLFNQELAIIAGCYDITDRKRLEKEILEISGREQQRLGQDLHDELSQQLTGISYMCRVLQEQLDAKSLDDARTAEEITRLVNQSISQTKILARGLFPVELEENGIISALRELSEKTEKQFHVPCHFICMDDVFITDNTIALHLYRIAQEAVHNAAKHANPDNIYIQLECMENKILLSIKDDGDGIDEERGDGKGMGLRIMKYRANMIGGNIQIGQGVKKGTVVICSVDNPAVKNKRIKIG
ncbi:MAG: substrate-binding domain-containing protein [Spirochaetales bacterium]|nr:substrate-binding domain-containing protein [Spirochaetales bacterium]